MIRVHRKKGSRRPTMLNTYEVFDYDGKWYTFFGGDDFEAIQRTFNDLDGRDGCLTKNGADLACFSTVEGVNVVFDTSDTIIYRGSVE